MCVRAASAVAILYRRVQAGVQLSPTQTPSHHLQTYEYHIWETKQLHNAFYECWMRSTAAVALNAAAGSRQRPGPSQHQLYRQGRTLIQSPRVSSTATQCSCSSLPAAHHPLHWLICDNFWTSVCAASQVFAKIMADPGTQVICLPQLLQPD
jgi:hypothetical protein